MNNPRVGGWLDCSAVIIPGDFKICIDSFEAETKAALGDIHSKVENLENLANASKVTKVRSPSQTQNNASSSSPQQQTTYQTKTPLPTKVPSAADPFPQPRAPAGPPPPIAPAGPPPLRTPAGLPLNQQPGPTRRKTAFLSRTKTLFVGDSVAFNTQFNRIEKTMNCRVKTMKAYSSVYDTKARWPQKNFMDVTPAALCATNVNDEFAQLILSAPTVDISNLKTSNLKPNDKTMVFHQNVIVSCKNMFTIAENALRNHKNLTKVVLLEHSPRFDNQDIDPIGLKHELAKFANVTYGQLWLTSPLKDKIKIGSHKLNCLDDSQFFETYSDARTHRFDGVHLYGKYGRQAYTNSLLDVLKCFLPQPHQPPHVGAPSHSDCPQTRFSNTQKKTTYFNQTHSNIYTVPVSNTFDVLGN